MLLLATGCVQQNSSEKAIERDDAWYQRLTEEELSNAKYLYEQDFDVALEAPCVLLYQNKALDFALYYSYQNWQYQDGEKVLIVSKGQKTVATGAAAWDRTDLREIPLTSADLDEDGFKEIVLPVVTGTGSGYFQQSFFVFDSSNDSVYDQLAICDAKNMIYCESEDSITYLHEVSVSVDEKDGTVIYKKGNDIQYTGHIKGLMESLPGITEVNWAECVYTQIMDDGKLALISEPCFSGEESGYNHYAPKGDPQNDVCNIIYEIEYLKDGTFCCTSVSFE